jgi:hypothetical protein
MTNEKEKLATTRTRRTIHSREIKDHLTGRFDG